MENNFNEIINVFKQKYILNKYNQKNNMVIEEIKKELYSRKDDIEIILKTENEIWNSDFKTEKLFETIEETIKEIENKKEKVFGIGNIIAITTGDMYLNIELILKAIATNCRIMIISNLVLFDINQYICEIVQNTLDKYNINRLNVSIVKDNMHKKNIINHKKYVDCIVVNQDYEEYSYFKNNTYSKTIYLDYGNINIYTDLDNNEEIHTISQIADKRRMIVYSNSIKTIEEILENQDNNFIYNTAIIYSKDLKKCMELYEILKVENVFINNFNIDKIKTKLKIEEFQFEKDVYLN